MNDLQRYLIYEFVEDYKDGYLSRRDMIRRVLHITGGVASTAAILTALGCGPGSSPTSTTAPTATSAAGAGGPSPTPLPTTAAASPTVSPPVSGGSPAPSPSPPAEARSPLSVPADDPAIEGRDITFAGTGTTLMAYQARPSDAAGSLPVVLVCHENQGLTEHIRDVTRRFAKAGYLACAVDLLSREGGSAQVTDRARIPGILSGADPNRHVGDFQSAVDYFQTQSTTARGDRIGMVGFCFGGGITWRSATAIADLTAAVPYYGPPPPLDQVPNIRAAVLGIYSSDPNDFANKGRDELEAALQAAGITHQMQVYPGTQHAFNNDTGPRWNQAQSLAAWTDTLDWLGRYLRA